MISDQEIIEKYTNNINLSTVQVDRFFNLYRSKTHRILKKYKIPIRTDSSIYRRFTLNQNFFEKIDTEAKAYFLGLLYADGNIIDKGKRKVMEICLIDRNILEVFKSNIETNKEIKIRKTIKNSKIYKDSYRLSVTNKKMVTDLINKGCIPRKSLILKFPTEEQVPEHLLRHFVRGYFDGDGCICVSKRPNQNKQIISLSIISTFNFCSSIKKMIKKQLNCNFYVNISKNGITTELKMGGNLQVKRLLDWFYKDSTIYLDRKYHKYIDFYKHNYLI